jgi:hypothetical protein
VWLCCLTSCGGGGSSPGVPSKAQQRLVGEVFAVPGELQTAEIVSNAGYSGNQLMSRAIRDVGKQNLLDMLFMFRPTLVSGQEYPVKLLNPEATQRLQEYVNTNSDLLQPGVRVLILDEIYWYPPNQSDDPIILNLQLESLKAAVVAIRTALPNAAIGITVTPYSTLGRPNTLAFIKQAIALVDWVGTDPYWFGDPAVISSLHDWSSTFHGLAKAANPMVETWFIAQAFKLPSLDTLTFNSVMTKELAYSDQYDHILFFGWQFVSELDSKSAGVNFSAETKQIYRDYLKK